MKIITNTKFREFIGAHHPEILKNDPKIVKIIGNNVVFEMENHEGRYCINLRGLEEFPYQ